MKNILFGFLVIMLVTTFGNAAVNLDSGNYVNEFGYGPEAMGGPSDLADFEAGSVATVSSTLGCVIQGVAPEQHILYKFTRTNTTKTGLVIIGGAGDTGSGDNSWIYIGQGTDPCNLSWNNVTNLGTTSKIMIPIGIGTYYVDVDMKPWGGVGYFRSVQAYADGSSFNALTVNSLSCRTLFHDACNNMATNASLAYSAADCGVAGPGQWSGVYIGQFSASDGVRYRFTGTAGQVHNAYFTLTGLDGNSGDNSWFSIQINDFAGNQLYWNNLTNLAGSAPGAKTVTLNLADIPTLAGATQFELHFSTVYTAPNTRLIDLKVGVDPLGGDINTDCHVDFVDFAQMAEYWIGN